jgi:membrane-bound ClpP family serine protease
VPGILAFLAFVLAFIFHGAGFAPDLWFNWQGLALAGFVLLTLDAAWPRFGTLYARRAVSVPPQP